MAADALTPPMPSTPVADMTLDQLQEIAGGNGLKSVGSRPPFGQYLKDLWGRRNFIWTLSLAKYQARNEGQKFGQMWAIVNPLLTIATYFFVFGFLLKTHGGMHNYVGYLSIGIIIFGMTASTMTSGSRSILNNTGLVRALHFPRAVLPISSVVTELLEAAVSIAMLMLIVPFTGDLPHLKWILLIPALIIHALIQTGFVLILARFVNMSADIWNLIPVFTRLLRYVSGVFFSIASVTQHHPLLYYLLEYQPFALTLSLVRQAMLGEFAVDWKMWAAGIAYAIVLPVAGLWIFWRDEAKYGRG
ncbi:ABC transporter permease [Luteococcus sanguinis]|uniref:Transport permease protein n=1 Tax=Luteococcus sanguinis TaxID=174038 RepID=A0ABW1X614_9ACTN